MTKQCKQCFLFKKLSEYSPKENGRCASRCKTCIAANKKAKYVPKVYKGKLDLVFGKKECITCFKIVSLSEFYSYIKNSKTYYRSSCNGCLAKIKQDKLSGVRQFIFLYLKDHPCTDCGEQDPIVLEFDHISNKEHNISFMISSNFSIDSIKNEILKCEVRCANCHRRKTAKDQDWHKWVCSVNG